MAAQDTPAEETPKDEVVEDKKDDVVSETPETDTPEIKEDKVDTPDITVKDDPPVETKETEEEFDLEEFKKSTAEEAQKAVMEKIAAGFGLTKDEEKKAGEEGVVPPWEERGESKPKSYKELAKSIALAVAELVPISLLLICVKKFSLPPNASLVLAKIN